MMFAVSGQRLQSAWQLFPELTMHPGNQASMGGAHIWRYVTLTSSRLCCIAAACVPDQGSAGCQMYKHAPTADAIIPVCIAVFSAKAQQPASGQCFTVMVCVYLQGHQQEWLLHQRMQQLVSVAASGRCPGA